MKIECYEGIYLPAIDLWLDPDCPKPRAVITHAHYDHIKDHRLVIASEGTAALMQSRLGGEREYQCLSFGERRDFGEFALTLYPAGHILGSSQALVEHQGVRLLYSGDFKMRLGLSSEPIKVPQADIVIMETTFGLPHYVFPPAEEVIDRIARFCHEAIFQDQTPILFGYALGKGQEIMSCLKEAQLPVVAHGSFASAIEIYQRFGVEFGEFEFYRAGMDLSGKVLLCPPNVRNTPMIQKIENRRTAYLSGWAMDRSARFWFRTDACFPLSDHADHRELLDYARLTGASKFYTTHGFASEFALDLRLLGFEAEPLLQLSSTRPEKPGAKKQLSLF